MSKPFDVQAATEELFNNLRYADEKWEKAVLDALEVRRGIGKDLIRIKEELDKRSDGAWEAWVRSYCTDQDDIESVMRLSTDQDYYDRSVDCLNGYIDDI